jgi:hypothetical protein
MAEHDAIVQMMEHYGKLYFYLAREMLDTFGEDGERALRRAVRHFAQDRGATLQQRHKEAGIPINLKSLAEHYDMPGARTDSYRRTIVQLDADHRVSETYVCQLAQLWSCLGGEEGLHLGSIYCDEFHPTMWSAYDPGTETTLPQLLTKSDPFCRFEVHRTVDGGETAAQ